ncbi:hypothetical protein BRARA_E00668 [Brassica rapa]|uniref:Uncharacterized protein n=1 Tax=Brassica campestris TaxID=3711 RepID=A0A397ZED7_BRACM|nr:hypothetical protein BRARA_E00668 [Brassica rapa]
MMMIMMQERKTLSMNDTDLSLLRLSSPPYDDSSFSPGSDESDHPKRRRLSSQDPIFISSPLRSTHPEPHSSNIDDQILTASPVLTKQETSSSASKNPDTETMKMANNHVAEVNQEETNYDAYEEEEEDCGEGMRIERSGDGFVIRLKCRCKLAFRILFSDHHLYFKSL